MQLIWLLAIIQLVLSMYAVGAKIFGTCKTCNGVFTSIVPASLGIGLYAIILVLLELRKIRLASLLTFVALCTHGLLVSHLVISDQRCKLCFSAFIGSIALFVAISSADTRIPLMSYAIIGAFVVIVGTLILTMLPIDQRFRFVESIPEQFLPQEDGSVTILMVEGRDCGGCEDFRKVMAPKLQREFGQRLRVVSVGTDQVPVAVTPTFVVGRTRNALKVGASDIPYSTMREWVLAMLSDRLE
jgi:hypothetical protein